MSRLILALVAGACLAGCEEDGWKVARECTAKAEVWVNEFTFLDWEGEPPFSQERYYRRDSYITGCMHEHSY